VRVDTQVDGPNYRTCDSEEEYMCYEQPNSHAGRRVRAADMLQLSMRQYCMILWEMSADIHANIHAKLHPHRGRG